MSEDRSSGTRDDRSLAPFAPPPRQHFLADLVKALASRFLAGEIAVGAKLPPERQLAEMFGVGRSQLREALKVLDLLGLIEIRQGDGTYLRGNTSEMLPQVLDWGVLLAAPETTELIDARFHLEIMLAGLAATRRTEDDVKAIGRTLEMMIDAVDITDFAQADTEFHMAIGVASKNKVLAGVLQNIKSLLQVWVLRVIRESGDRGPTIEQHRAVYEAIMVGRPDQASDAMRTHMEAAAGTLRASINRETASEQVR